jgi:hypothetical protein
MTKYLILTTAIFFSFQTAAEENINNQIDLAEANLEILNSLATRCSVEIDVYGAEALQKNACTKLITNAGGDFMTQTTNACKAIIDWSKANRQTQVTHAQFNRIGQACNPQRYPYITKALTKIRSLQKLQ